MLSRSLAQQLGAPKVSFGDAVRREANRLGLAENREALQNLGDSMITAGWDAFCELTVAAAGEPATDILVVDGVRHLGAISGLSRIAAPSATFVVFIDAPWERRLSWLHARGISTEEALAADSHSNEAEVTEVRRVADLVIMNDGTVDDAVSEIMARLIDRGLARAPDSFSFP